LKREKLEVYGLILDSKLIIEEQEELKSWISHLPENQEIQIKLVPVKSIRTLKQNALLWSLYKRIGDYIGEHKENLHIYFKSKFLPPKIVEVNNEQIWDCGSTVDLTTKEMCDYIFKIHQWASENIQLDLLSYDEKQFLKS
jgi:hypothetical protein